MSIQAQIDRIRDNLSDAYNAVSAKGGTLPAEETSANLAAAVSSIPTESGDGVTAYLVRAPIGTIVIWSGTAEDIPSGWALCDGQNGRPDLRNKFVIGAGGAYTVGETGGEAEVTLTGEQMPKHSHGLISGKSAGTGESLGSAHITYESSTAASTLESGGSEPHNNLPPYYALCYIIKITRDETDGGTGGGVTMDEVNEAISAAITGAIKEAY